MIGDKASFLAALHAGAFIAIDGAMGTEIERRGKGNIAADDWLLANVGAPETVAEIHADYANAGARLHIANSFAAGRHVLEQVGLAERFEALNRDAVRICKDAISPRLRAEGWIAGSISTYMVGSDRSLLPPLEQLHINARDQARILAEEGCALLVLEMLFDVDVSLALFAGAAEVGLPISVGFTCEFDVKQGATMRGWGDRGERFSDVLDSLLLRLPQRDGTILSVMHSLPDATDAALADVMARWDGPIAVYPNAGRHQRGHGWQYQDVPSPQEFSDQCSGWRSAGATILGGCCGLGPDHISAMVERFDHC